MHANDTLPTTLAVSAATAAVGILDRGFKSIAVKHEGKVYKITESLDKNFACVMDVSTGEFLVATYSNKPGRNSVFSIATALDSLGRGNLMAYEVAAQDFFDTFGRPASWASIEDCASYAFDTMSNKDFGRLPTEKFMFYLAAVAYGFDSDEVWAWIDRGLDIPKSDSITYDVAQEIYRLHAWKTKEHVYGF